MKQHMQKHIQQHIQQHMQTLINLLKKNDLTGLMAHYHNSSEAENIAQLGFIFTQGQKNPPGFEFYQQLATKFIAAKGLPAAVISRIHSSDALSFFTPALQLNDNFKQTDQRQRNVLHYLLAGEQSPNHASASKSQPPFNYLRSMMLFESNETLHDALCQRDKQHLTPVEWYLFANQNLANLPGHEFTALLALIEIESKKQRVDETNYLPIIKAVKQLCRSQSLTLNHELQRLVLIATYYGKSVEQVLG